MAEPIRIHNRYLPARLRSLSQWRVPVATQEEVRRFVEEAALGKVNPGHRLSEARQAKYIDLLRVPLEFLAKPTSRLVLADIERFEHALTTDGVRSPQKQAPYAASTKADIRKALRVFLRWRSGAAQALHLAGWLDVRDHPKTPQYLSESEVEALFKACRTTEQRFLVALLFDSGARAAELLNVRMEDLHLPQNGENFAKLTLKREYSKTLGRTISLYWRHSLEAVRDHVRQRFARGARPDDPVVSVQYDACRMFLNRLGRKVLSKRVHPHLLRHSSATYYATRLNRQELCYRYGWRFSSHMPDIYISRAGMENKELDQKFTSTELGGLKDDLARLQQQNQLKEDRLAKLQGTLEEMQRHWAQVSEVLTTHPKIHDVQAALRRKLQTCQRPPAKPEA